MFVKIIDSKEDNDMLKEIIAKIGDDNYKKIETEINVECDKCPIGKAISLKSIYGSDWGDYAMQSVYDVLQDYDKTKLYAGIIMKEIIKNSKYKFRVEKSNDANIYYKEC